MGVMVVVMVVVMMVAMMKVMVMVVVKRGCRVTKTMGTSRIRSSVGVVGYHACLTRPRSRVDPRTEYFVSSANLFPWSCTTNMKQLRQNAFAVPMAAVGTLT